MIYLSCFNHHLSKLNLVGEIHKILASVMVCVLRRHFKRKKIIPMPSLPFKEATISTKEKSDAANTTHRARLSFYSPDRGKNQHPFLEDALFLKENEICVRKLRISNELSQKNVTFSLKKRKKKSDVSGS